jgi:hypothetical protein
MLKPLGEEITVNSFTFNRSTFLKTLASLLQYITPKRYIVNELTMMCYSKRCKGNNDERVVIFFHFKIINPAYRKYISGWTRLGALVLDTFALMFNNRDLGGYIQRKV